MKRRIVAVHPRCMLVAVRGLDVRSRALLAISNGASVTELVDGG